MNPRSTHPLPHGLRSISEIRTDTENNIIELDEQYELVNGDISETIEYLKLMHGNNICLIPIAGQSAGGGVFTTQKTNDKQVAIGLIITPPTSLSEKNNIKVTISETAPTDKLRTQELHINRRNKVAYAGAGVVLDQISASVQEVLGENYQVQGTDLTSSSYASACATFMTGGMGPTRINFAQSILEIVYYNGECSKHISDKNELQTLLETYGWTGFVERIAVPIIKVPPHEFGFAVPVNNTSNEIARLVEYFADKTIVSKKGFTETNVFIAGLEIITGDALQLLVAHAPNTVGLNTLMNNCQAANKDAVVFISGLAQSNPFEDAEDHLRIFVDNATSGLSLELATPFSNLQEMKTIREAAPELARRQFMDAPFSYKDHTDINVSINLEKCLESVEAIMNCYADYKINVEKLIAAQEKLTGNVQVYGHINPQGFDPHYRITLVSDSEEIMLRSKKKAQELYTQLVQDISNTCQKTDSKICGGEKGIISNLKIVNAFDTNPPAQLLDILQKQQTAISAAHSMFNWRAQLNFTSN